MTGPHPNDTDLVEHASDRGPDGQGIVIGLVVGAIFWAAVIAWLLW